jgi:hypothetical protein
MTAREKMLARVRAIMAKTLENGCTEGEAMAALDKARELIAAYDISEAELGATNEPERATVSKDATSDPYDIKRWLSVAVGRFTRCRVWNGKAAGYAVGLAGLEADVAFANWLLDTLAQYVLRELRIHQAQRRAQGLTNPRIIGASFVQGCCTRIGERLKELAPKDPVDVTGNANALVVSRKALISKAMADAGIHLQKGRRSRRNVNMGAYGAGTSAGNGATFSRPVNHGGGVALLR